MSQKTKTKTVSKGKSKTATKKDGKATTQKTATKRRAKATAPAAAATAADAAVKPAEVAPEAPQPQQQPERKFVLVLRTCTADMRARNPYRDFTYPTSGPVRAPDWDGGQEKCGGGLHGWEFGVGDHTASNTIDLPDAKWVVIKVEDVPHNLVRLPGKVKFCEGEVVHVGDKNSANKFMRDNGGERPNQIGGLASAGYLGTASAGYLGTASAGDRGTASAGYLGTASAGDRGTASAGDRGTASAGEEGVLNIAWWDGDTSKYRWEAGIVGESLDKDGSVIQPSTYYRLAADRKLERLPLADRIEIMLGDITKLDERPDVIVNAANESLLGGGGVDGAIHAAAGPDLLKACQGLGGCKTGHVKITEGYGLRCKYIFHAVGPRWAGGEHGEVVDLAAVYRRIVEKAAELKALTVVVPSISTGAFGYPLEQAAEVAVESLAKALDKAPLVRSVKFVCFDDKTKAAYLVAHRHYFAAPAQSLNKVQ